MISISIIGSGNIAHHLITAIQQSVAYGVDIELVQVYSRNKSSLLNSISSDKIITDFNDFNYADLYIIAVSDGIIAEIATALPFENRFVVHTSGSVPMNALADKNRKGVFYPLQTFSKTKAIDFSNVPICLESETEDDYNLLHQVASLLSQSIYSVSSEQRKGIHVSAVFVSNFVNHLYQIGHDICKQHNLPFAILKPLIQETAQKILYLTPKEAQTGPAKRHDTTTINTHLQFLTETNHKDIYTLLTKSIIDHEQKL